MGTVVPFRRPGRPRRPSPVGAVVVTLAVVDGEVVLGIDSLEVDLTPEQARELSRDLADLASDAEARRG